MMAPSRGAWGGPASRRASGQVGAGLLGAWVCLVIGVGCEGKKAAAPAAPAPATSSTAPAPSQPAPASGTPVAAPSAPAPAAKPAAGAADAPAAPAGVSAGVSAGASAGASKSAVDEEPTLEELLESPERDVERSFDELKDSTADAISEEQQRSIERALTELLGAPTTVQHPIAVQPEGKPLAAYLLYEHAASVGPTKDELALNPGCKEHGVAFAQARGDELEVVAMPLATGGCDLRVRHWFVANVGGSEAHADAFLEVVASKVTARRPSKKGKQVTTLRKQVLAIWENPTNHTDGIAEPTFSLDVDQWESQPWRSRERPALDSVLLSRAGSTMRIVHLLPCYDPWTYEACNADLRKRKVYEY